MSGRKVRVSDSHKRDIYYGRSDLVSVNHAESDPRNLVTEAEITPPPMGRSLHVIRSGIRLR